MYHILCSFLIPGSCSYVGPHTRIWVALNFWNDYLYLIYKLMEIHWFIPFFPSWLTILRWIFSSMIILIMRQLYLWIYSNSILTMYIFHFRESMWMYINAMPIYRDTHLDINLLQLPLKTGRLGRDWQVILVYKVWKNTKQRVGETSELKK